MSSTPNNYFKLLSVIDKELGGDEPNEENIETHITEEISDMTIICDTSGFIGHYRLDETDSSSMQPYRGRYRTNRGRFNRGEIRERRTQPNEDKMLNSKTTYDENVHGKLQHIGIDMKLNSYWTVWIHKNECADWTLNGYQKRYVINNLSSFWIFFNNLQFYDMMNNQFFIMREEIAPIWEDLNNKFGGVCSLKIDSIQRGLRTDISMEIFNIISMLIMNETFIPNNENINGLCFNVKRRSSFIKIWTKTLYEEKQFISELPKSLFDIFNVELQKQPKRPNEIKDMCKLSIRYTKITPEYDL